MVDEPGACQEATASCVSPAIEPCHGSQDLPSRGQQEHAWVMAKTSPRPVEVRSMARQVKQQIALAWAKRREQTAGACGIPHQAAQSGSDEVGDITLYKVPVNRRLSWAFISPNVM